MKRLLLIEINMNNLIELSEKLKTVTKPQQRIDVSGEVSYEGINKTYRKHKVQMDLYKTFISITIHVNSNLALAINKPDAMFGYKVPFQMDDSPYPIFVSASQSSFVKDENSKKFLNEVLVYLKTLELSDRESAYMYNNGMRFILLPKRDIKEILDSLIELIGKNAAIFNAKSEQAISKKNIPDNLVSLSPFLKKYAIADDSTRAELVEAMGAEKKKVLIEVVGPLLGEIDRYLNSFGDRPLTEEAMLIGNLAELVRVLINVQ